MSIWPFKRRPAASPEPVDPDPVEVAPSGPYDGPRCWVPVDEYIDNGDGTFTRVLEGGWHYSTRINEHGHEVPDRKLHLHDVGGEDEWYYEYAEPGHRSWVEKHGVGQPVPLSPLPAGIAYPPEAMSDHPEHNTWRRFKLCVEEIGSKKP